jgi:MFS family permease
MEMTPGDVLARAPTTATDRQVSLVDQINLNVFWLAVNCLWGPMTAIILSSMVAKYFGDAHKDINLTLVVIWGILVALIVQPVAGALSDRVTFRLGRRRPFLLIGTSLTVPVLLVFAFAPTWFPAHPSLLLLALLVVLLQLGTNVATGPWGAIIADQVPPRQRGLTSGLNSLFSIVGIAVGSVIAGSLLNKHDPLPIYNREVLRVFVLVALIQILVVTYAVLTVKEAPKTVPTAVPTATSPTEAAPAERLWFGRIVRHILVDTPARYPDYAWVLLARLLMMLGFWSIASFVQYYADDVLGGPRVRTILFNTPFSGEQFVGTLFLPIGLLMALPAALLAGWASDLWGRKRLVYVSGALMTVVCLVFIFVHTQVAAIIAAAFFGLGNGAYGSVDWALTADVLPPTDEAGTFLGIWSAMAVVAQVMALTLGGVLLQTLRGLPLHLGYAALFGVMMVCFALGTAVIRQVTGAT